MIPKILHFIWVGNKSIPEYSLSYINKFKIKYDDYDVKLWREEDVDKNDLIPNFLKDYYYNNKFHPAFKADILRYLILNKYGGLYFDIDFEPLKKLPDCFLNFDFLGAIQPNGEVNIAFIASVKNNPLLIETINQIPVSIQIAKNNNYYTDLFIHRMTGPEFFNPIISKYKKNSNCFFFTKEYFYPYDFNQTERFNEDFKQTSPLSYAVHHWFQSWKK